MGYDIIERVAELAACNHGDDLPDEAARFLMGAFSFDYCGVYVWNEQAALFTLRASCGDETNSVGRYSAASGIPGLVREKMAAVDVTVPASPDAVAAHPSFDCGLDGFAWALAYPLSYGNILWGVLYFKARRATGLTIEERRTLEVAVKTLMTGLRCADLRAKYLGARSEVLEIQARLADSEKLLALVDMASTLAHEIRSPLISIGGFTGRLKKKIAAGDPALRYVARIEAETTRLEKLIDGMIGFLREVPAEFSIGDINEIVEDALGFFTEDFIVHGIRVIRQMHKGPLRVLADRVQIKIAFDNLIVNAIQSMDSGGVLVIRTERSDGNVVVILSDSGGGIDHENVEKIFTPFFTTKSSGTGLGLPITKSIIARHNGFISVENNAGVGVTFYLGLPEAGEETEDGTSD